MGVVKEVISLSYQEICSPTKIFFKQVLNVFFS